MPPENDDMISYRLTNLERITAEMSVAVKSIAESLNTLARLEVRHEETRDALGRAFTEIERNKAEQGVINRDVEERMRTTEKEMPTLKLTRGWMITGATSALGILGLAIVALVMK